MIRVSLRQEVEQAMGLRFPAKNGEAMIEFEESMDTPRGAEALLNGLYRDPNEIKRNFHILYQVTSNLLEILMPRRARLKEWLEELPDQPKEAESFIRETSEEIKKHDRKAVQIEKDLINMLEESNIDDLFPLPLNVFAIISYSDPTVKLYLRTLGKLAEVLKLNPETLRQVVRIHFLYCLLLLTGLDMDGENYKRGSEDLVANGISAFFTLKHINKRNQEMKHCYLEWLKSWGSKKYMQIIPQESSIEKVHAAMIFWRRNPNITWEGACSIIESVESSEHTTNEYTTNEYTNTPFNERSKMRNFFD